MAVMFDWIREAMPAEAPGTLSKDDTASVIAYILQLNKMPAGKQDLSVEPDALGRIQSSQTSQQIASKESGKTARFARNTPESKHQLR